MYKQLEDHWALPLPILKEKSLFFLDRDGTLIIEDRPLPGAKEFIQRLREKKKLFYLLTNNSSRTPQSHYEVLKGMGFSIERRNILVSLEAALSYLKDKGIRRLYWVANQEVSQFMEREGFNFEDEKPSAILLTYDTEITYQKLVDCCHFIRSGCPYYATHPDHLYITKEGGIPDIGTFMKVIEMTTGALPQKIFGKPYPNFFYPTLKKHALKEQDAVIIGDRLDTDIQMAQDNQLTSVLVLSGVTNYPDLLGSPIKPHLLVASIGELIEYI